MKALNLVKAIGLSLFSLIAINNTNAQGFFEKYQPSGTTVTESGVKATDNFYDRNMTNEKQILAYDFIHEKDVMWSKTIWREIDVREKMNHHFSYEKMPLAAIILEAAKRGDAQVYDVFDDEFRTKMTDEQVRSMMGSYDTITTYDPITFAEVDTVVYNQLDLNDIKKYRVKEVWFFDEETSNMQVRIIGLAPIMDRFDNNGNFLNSGPMCWFYYPELRYVLANFEAFNPANDAARMSWDDIFEARFFSSYITKKSNVRDERIQDKFTGIDAMLEAEKIQQEIFNFEHDLWSY